MIGIYKITNPKGRIYIGQSVNLEKRIKYYKYGYAEKQRRLFNSLQKYGYDNHKFEIITTCNIEDLNTQERYYQELYNVLDKNGLNCEYVNTKNKRRILSDASKKAISIKNKGKNNGMYGTKMPEEEKQKRRNHKHDNLTLKKISERSNRGNNPNAKIVLCTQTGIFYDCGRDASEALGLPYSTVRQWLSGRRKNKSYMTYC